MRKEKNRNRYPLGNRHKPLPRKKMRFGSAFFEETKNFFDEVQLSVLGDRELFLEGICSIAEYDDGYIRLVTRKGELLVTGRDLVVLGYGPTVMTIAGKIGGITWNG